VRIVFSMDGLSSSLAVLTAMITPAVLISASGTMILSTSSRLGRVVDRVRSLSDRLQELSRGDSEIDLLEERRAMLFDQLDKLTSRSRLLQRALTTFYLAVGVFVATSVAIGVVAFFGARGAWVPVAMGLIGAFFSFLRQHAFGLRGATGVEHHARRDGFHLAHQQAVCAARAGRAAQE